jgi:maltooligosyltrehalose trehalohydrolase
MCHVANEQVVVAPTLGAWVAEDGVRFRVWAPESTTVDVVYERLGATVTRALEPEAGGIFAGWVPGIGAGIKYRFCLDRDRLLPDPASRWQPDGIDGPSAIVDASRFAWTDRNWRGIALEDLVIYELHVGTFSKEGTFAGVEQHLDHLRQLGVTAIEIMPIGEYAGRHNWGYDGVFLYAPSRNYGAPDDLRHLVDTAHRCGLGVILDVVYNHVGPDGACWRAYTPRYFTDRYTTPWGAAVNLDGEDAAFVREFLLQNALHWVHEYHVDGLRLDATHTLHDHSDRPFLAEFADVVHRATDDRRVLVIAEDERHLLQLVEPRDRNGFSLDAMWVDDFHHELRRLVAGDHEGYFSSYSGTAAAVATTLATGGYLSGEAEDLKPFVLCLQNHDQVGNRALGDRLHHAIDPASSFRAASVLLLCAPETPLIFMGQEWAASTPFCYFTDHRDELGREITEGRRSEFEAFAAFRDPTSRESIPDPQDEQTFVMSRLKWEEIAAGEHRRVLRLYQRLLELRHREPAMRASARHDVAATAPDEGTVAVWRNPPQAAPLLIVARLIGPGEVEIPLPGDHARRRWTTVLTTEDVEEPSEVPRVEERTGALRIAFARPGAVVLRG